jgi:hypothetical protein
MHQARIQLHKKLWYGARSRGAALLTLAITVALRRALAALQYLAVFLHLGVVLQLGHGSIERLHGGLRGLRAILTEDSLVPVLEESKNALLAIFNAALKVVKIPVVVMLVMDAGNSAFRLELFVRRKNKARLEDICVSAYGMRPAKLTNVAQAEIDAGLTSLLPQSCMLHSPFGSLGQFPATNFRRVFGPHHTRT